MIAPSNQKRSTFYLNCLFFQDVGKGLVYSYMQYIIDMCISDKGIHAFLNEQKISMHANLIYVTWSLTSMLLAQHLIIRNLSDLLELAVQLLSVNSLGRPISKRNKTTFSDSSSPVQSKNNHKNPSLTCRLKHPVVLIRRQVLLLTYLEEANECWW